MIPFIQQVGMASIDERNDTIGQKFKLTGEEHVHWLSSHLMYHFIGPGYVGGNGVFRVVGDDAVIKVTVRARLVNRPINLAWCIFQSGDFFWTRCSVVVTVRVGGINIKQVFILCMLFYWLVKEDANIIHEIRFLTRYFKYLTELANNFLMECIAPAINEIVDGNDHDANDVLVVMPYNHWRIRRKQLTPNCFSSSWTLTYQFCTAPTLVQKPELVCLRLFGRLHV